MKYQLEGVPQPLKRHRQRGKICYDPQRAAKIEAAKIIRQSIKAGFEPYQTPIKLIFEYHMPIPKSLSKKKKAELEGKPHEKRPDLSNLIKFTEDAFNTVIWADDSLIVEIEARKIYSTEPKTVFWVELVEDIAVSQGFDAVSKKAENKKIRQNIPKINTKKFREILLYLVKNFKGFRVASLNQLLYLIDFNFYEKQEEHLVGATYIKSPEGPEAVEMESMLRAMLLDNELKTRRGLYTNLRNFSLDCLSDKEKIIVDEVVSQFYGKEAAVLKSFCLKDVPFRVSSFGEDIDYETVFYREE